MVNKIGIKINKNEAFVLLKSADINGDNALDMEEFISLIHSTNEALDVNLKDFEPMNDEINRKGGNSKDILGKLQQVASNTYENKLDNQLRLFLQKSCHIVARDCLNEDQEVDGSKTYQINKTKLKTILKHRLKLPEILKDDTTRLEKIIDEYVTDKNTEMINYKNMIEDMQGFNYDVESGSVGGRKLKSPHSVSELSDHTDSPRNALTILDIQKVPFNKELDIQSRSNKLNRMLKLHFKTEQQLTRHLKSSIDVDKNGTIDLNEFKTLIVSTFKNELENSIIGKKDIECFLSNFIYNKYGHTSVEEIAPRIFAAPEDFNKNTNNMKRPKPPPSNVNDGLLQDDPNANDKFYIQRVKTLTDKIVSKALNACNSKYQCFKYFDKDDDGYISYKDFADKVREMEINATTGEIMSVIKGIDMNKNGYVDFKEFMKHFTPNLPETVTETLPYFKNKNKNGLANGNNVPNKELVLQHINRSKSTNKEILN